MSPNYVPVNHLPQIHARLHVDESLPDVLGEDRNDRDVRLKRDGREPRPLLPHHPVIGVAQLSFVPTPGGDPEQVTFA